MNDRLTKNHLERDAYVYVRQSSGHHHQGRQRQYDLAARARELGFARVEVIDDDQGKTGSGMVERPGFAALLSAVCSGQVGAVFALEASRLARNNRDWHHLIDLCALTHRSVLLAIIFHFIGNLTGQLPLPSDEVRHLRLLLEVVIALIVLILWRPGRLPPRRGIQNALLAPSFPHMAP